MVKDSGKKRLVLIDSHAILHRAFHALPNFTSPTGEPTGALYGFSSTLLKIMREFKPDYIAAAFDLPLPTFRHLIYKKYKGKRPKIADELASQIESSKKILEVFGIPVYEAAGFEADDILATIVSRLKNKKDLEIIIVTGDLDTLQLVGKNVKVYTMKKGIQDTILYDEKAVKERFGFPPKLLPDFKGLKGDPSDNIIGVKGIGDKTAESLIKNFGSLGGIFKAAKKDRPALLKAGVSERMIGLLLENEEEAYFSKTLAETREDAPVPFSMEDSFYREKFKREKAESLFRELGFKSLLNRIPAPVGAEKEKKEDGAEEESDAAKELKVAFWLLDSRRTNPSLKDIFSFCRVDSFEAGRNIIEEQLKKDGLWELWSGIELPLKVVLSRMEERGIILDVDYLKSLSDDYHGKINELEEKIYGMAGEKFNINSPGQMAKILFEKLGIKTSGLRRTSGGRISTGFDELEKIQDKHPIVKEIFLHRELSKLISTYVDNLPLLVSKDGRLHTSFNQTGTVTGRLSSFNPNLQNIPIRTDFGRAVRKAFVSPEGFSILTFDYSQIELRVAASLSGDEKLKQAFFNGDDIHRRVAVEVFNVAEENVDAEMRRRAKVINFGIIYGMGINALKKNLGCSREEAEIFYDEYFRDFSGMAEYMEKAKAEARKNGYTSTLFGRRRYLPEINSPVEYIRKEAERMALNAPIQGTAADIIKSAMVKIGRIFKENKLTEEASMLLQVHDELIFEIKDDIIKEISAMIKKAMEEQSLIVVPLIAEVKKGPNWMDMEKIQ